MPSSGGLSDDEVATVWSRAVREMRSRGVLRSSNDRVADFAERVAATELGLKVR